MTYRIENTRFYVDETIYQEIKKTECDLEIAVIPQAGTHTKGVYRIPHQVAMAFIESKRVQFNWKNNGNFHQNSIPTALTKYFEEEEKEVIEVIEDIQDVHYHVQHENEKGEIIDEIEYRNLDDNRLGIILGVASFVVPIVGIVIWLMNLKSYPNKASSALWCAIISVVISIFLIIV